ncbi:GAF and ANTAR domain-containing protein [Rhodococcus triatomae]
MSNPDDDSIETIRSALTRALTSGEDPRQVLGTVCRAFARIVPADGMSVAMSTRPDNRQLVFASDSVSEHVELLQHTLGVGPCVDAVVERAPVLVPDIGDASGRWPALVAELSALPVSAMFSLPLRAGAAVFGSLELYRRTPGMLESDQITAALRIGDVIAVALLALATADGGSEVDPLRLAGLGDGARSSDALHQATGMLMAHYRIPAGSALARLRGYAYANGRLAHDVARDLTTRRLRVEDIDL